MSSIKVSIDYDMAAIANAAGSTDPEARWYSGGVLHVSDVSQEALDAALARYDGTAITTERTAALIAARRYQAETVGISINGMAIDTGRDSQGLITGARLAGMDDPSYVCNWKTPDGFVQLDAGTVKAIATAVRAHVQTCFDREAELLAKVADGTYTAEALEEGWP